jgi:MFS family permease
MLVGRTIQGLGGGILFSLSIALIRVVFPKALWTRAIGVQSTMWGIATLVGPAVGGIFAEFNIWRAAFWTLMPLAAVFVILAIVVLPVRSRDKSEALRLPLAQLLLLTAASLVISTSSVAQTAVWGIAGMLAGFLLVVLLAVTEARASHRLLPRGTLKFRTALGALYATVALLVMASTSEIFVPYFLQVLHGQSPLIAGYLAALAAAGWSAGSILSSSWSGAAGLRTILASPIILLVGILALMVLLPLAGGRADWLLLTVVSVALALVGLGIGIGWPHLYAHVIQNAPASEQDLAGSAIVTVQLFAQALGAAAAGMVVNFAGLTEPGGVAGARNAAFWLFAVFALAPALAIVTARRGVRDTVDKTPAAGVAAKGS